MKIINNYSKLYLNNYFFYVITKNKVIIGYTRFGIYPSKQIAIISMYLVYTDLFMLATIILNFMFIGTANLNKEYLLTSIIASKFVITFISTINAFIAVT